MAEPDVSPPAPAKKPYALPLTLTVRDVRKTKLHVEFDCLIEDAAGRNVQALPLSVDVSTGHAEATAILQATVTQTAEAMAKRGEAVAEPANAPNAALVETLKGTTFRGSALR